MIYVRQCALYGLVILVVLLMGMINVHFAHLESCKRRYGQWLLREWKVFRGAFRRRSQIIEFQSARCAGQQIPIGRLTSVWEKMMSFDPEENANKYLFKCEQCDCVLRVPVTDVVGVGRSALLSWQGLAKKAHGKQTGAIYVTVEEVGKMQTTELYKEKEMTLEELNALAESI